MRRAFSDSERAALFLAADGKCSLCQEPLTAGWHADHITPHVAGGPTDVVNGQALCPTCNLKKGSRMTMRAWQTEATSKWEQHRLPDFLAVATPGSGKTRWALNIAHRDRLRGATSRVIVVVPRTELRTQWADAAAEHADLQLDPRWSPADGALAANFSGIVTTYQAVAAAPQSFRRLCSVPTLLIADEIHHCGDDETLRWGEALRTAFEPAVKRLLLSGTPFRSDAAPIPFVNYDEVPGGRQAIADYSYGYGQAVRDRVCRHIDFRTYDGQVRWLDVADCATADRRATLSPDLRDQDRSRALATALDPSGQWMPGLLAEADRALTVMREERPDAGGLVIAYRQEVARKYAETLRGLTGEMPTLVLSDDDQAAEHLRRYREGKTRWLVAVDMVSEGVDIARLSVAVLATQKRTEMFFRQAVGRVVRRRGLDDPHAVVFIPKVEPFVGFAQDLEREQMQVLAEARERADKARAEAGTPTTFTVLGSDAPMYAGSVYAGEEFPAAVVLAEEERLEAIGVPRQYAVALLRAAQERAAAVPQATITIEPTPAAQPLYEYREELRAALTKEVGRAAARLGDYRKSKEIRAGLYRTFKKPVSECSIEELERAIAIVQNL